MLHSHCYLELRRLTFSPSRGSFAISPNGEYIAATNLKNGLDWYSTTMGGYVTKTAVRDSYDKKSMMMPVAFLTESTAVCGHHRGFLAVVQHGHDKPRVLGELGGPPAQYVVSPSLMGLDLRIDAHSEC